MQYLTANWQSEVMELGRSSPPRTGKSHTGKSHTGKSHTGKSHTGKSPSQRIKRRIAASHRITDVQDVDHLEG
jgi:hypothetical protein